MVNLVDLGKLTHDPIFELKTKTLGRVIVDRLSVRHLISVEKALKERGDVSPIDLTDIFIGLLAKTENGESLIPEQIASFSLDEKEDFAENLINTIEYMYHDLMMESSKDQEGKTVVSCQKGELTVPRTANEPATAYLKRVLLNYYEEQAKVLRSLKSGSINDSLLKRISGWASPSTLSALTRNAEISEQIAKSLAVVRTNDALLRWNEIAKASDLFARGNNLNKPYDAFFTSPEIHRVTNVASLNEAMRAADTAKNAFKSAHLKPENAGAFKTPKIEIPQLPPNPIHRTNEKLDDLLEKFERFETIAGQTVELVHSMNTAASGLLEAFANGARDTEKYSRRSIKIAWIALSAAIVMPIGQIGYDMWKSQQQDAETKRFVQGVVQQFLDTELKSSNGFKDAMSERLNQSRAGEAEIAKALSSLSSEIRALRESQPDRSKR